MEKRLTKGSKLTVEEMSELVDYYDVGVRAYPESHYALTDPYLSKGSQLAVEQQVLAREVKK